MSNTDDQPIFACDAVPDCLGHPVPGDICTPLPIEDPLDNDNQSATDFFYHGHGMVSPNLLTGIQAALALPVWGQRSASDDHRSQPSDDTQSLFLPEMDPDDSTQHSTGMSSVEFQTPPRDIWRREGPRSGPTVCPKDLEKRLSQEVDRLSKELESFNLAAHSSRTHEHLTLATVAEEEALRQQGWLATWSDIRYRRATLIDPSTISSSETQRRRKPGRPAGVPFPYDPSQALEHALHGIYYKKGPWSDRHRGALVQGILGGSQTPAEASPWSEADASVVRRSVAYCTQQTSKANTLWSEEELSALAETIADRIRTDLVEINSWSVDEWTSLHRTVARAVRLIFYHGRRPLDKEAVVKEKAVMTRFSEDFDRAFFQKHCGHDNNINGEKRYESVAHDEKKWAALAPLINQKLPFLDTHTIIYRATRMKLKKTYKRSDKVRKDPMVSDDQAQVPHERLSESEERIYKKAKTVSDTVVNSGPVTRVRQVARKVFRRQTSKGAQASGSGSSS